MTARWAPADEPFFREWNARRPGQTRSLPRARQLAAALDVSLDALPPTLTVVGSKGKGTAVACAAAVLHAAGKVVGTITSPPFRSNRERIRVDGRALTASEYEELATRLDAALARLPRGDGYVSPTGAFTIAGVRFLLDRQVDVLILEEGLGGGSDEVSLASPTGAAVTEIFLEHRELLGGTLESIAADLLAVVNGATRVVWSVRQSRVVDEIVRGIATRHAAPVRDPSELVDPSAVAHIAGLGAKNAQVGAALGRWFAAESGMQLTPPELSRALAAVRLPGRLSVHPPDGGRRATWVVDAAISPPGVGAAVEWCSANVGDPTLVLASFPDGKDASGCFRALAGRRVVAVTAGETHLRFTSSAPTAWRPAREALEAAGREDGVVLCVGTISFIGEVLEHLDAPTDRLW